MVKNMVKIDMDLSKLNEMELLEYMESVNGGVKNVA
jgi:hypothetical protein